MRFNGLSALNTTLRVGVAVGMLLTSGFAQSGTPHTTADAPAPADAAGPSTPHAPPVVMAFTDPSACAAFEQDGYPCRGLVQDGTPVGVEVTFAGRVRDGLPLAVPGRRAPEDWRGFDWLELELENRSPERLTVGLLLPNDPASWAEGKAAGFTLALDAATPPVTWRVPLRHLQYTVSGRTW